jgi:hypothetical protein
MKEHMRDLKRGKHHCAHLQNAWSKYGAQQFEIRDQWALASVAEARELEQGFLECFIDLLFNSRQTAIGAAWGDLNQAKRPDWHMKTVMQRLTPEQRRAIYGKTKGTKRDGAPYIGGAAKRLADPEFTTRLSAACKGKREVVECPHCGVTGGGGNMRRYHFDKCKERP